MPETGFLARNGQSIIGITADGDVILASTPGYYTKKGGIFIPDSNGGILMKDLAEYIIETYNVIEAFRPDGGNESSIYHKDIGVKNITLLEYSNEIPTALFIFNKEESPDE